MQISGFCIHGSDHYRGVIQSKCWKNELKEGVVRDLQEVLANQYPDQIGIIVINQEETGTRAKNLARNSKNTILIYDFNELRYLKKDLKRLSKQNKLQTSYCQVENFENGEIIEKTHKVKRKIKFEKYSRFSVY